MISPRIKDQLEKCIEKTNGQVVTCDHLYAELNESVDVANKDYRQYSLTSPYVSFPIFNNDVDLRNKELKLMLAQNKFVSLISQCLGYLDALISNEIDNEEMIEPYILQSLNRLTNMIKPATVMYTNLSAVSFVITRLECEVLQKNSFRYIGLRNKLANFRINLQ